MKSMKLKGATVNIGRKKDTDDLGDALDERGKCCGVDCCRRVLTLEDQVNNTLYVGYFKEGIWTTKTKNDFDTNGA